MRLEVRGMRNASQTFVQLWGMYVRAFDSSKHCQYCLTGRRETALSRETVDGDYELATDFPYFYLFGMGRGDRSISNVHLPEGWNGLGKDFTSCRNLRFGVQVFGYRAAAIPQTIEPCPISEAI